VSGALLPVLLAALGQGVEEDVAVVHEEYFEFFVGLCAEKALTLFHVAVFDDFNLHDVLDF
jgi:hypothetical protein